METLSSIRFDPSSPTFSQILNSISIEVSISFKSNCSNPVFIADPNAFANLNQESLHKYRSASTFLILSLLAFQNSTSNPSYNYPNRLCRPYSIVFNSIPADIFSREDEWKLVSYPGSPWHDYHIFMLPKRPDTLTDNSTTEIQFARQARRLLKSFFVIPSGNETAKVFTLATNSEYLKPVQDISRAETEQIKSSLFEPNYEGSSFIALVCATCGVKVDFHNRGVLWYDGASATVLEIARSANASVELEIMFSLPAERRTEDDDGDDWILAIINGNAAISSLSRDTVLGNKVVYYTRPISYDNAVFITTNPKRAYKTEVILKLLSPLSFNVWVALVTSVFMLFVALEITVRSDLHKVPTPASSQCACPVSQIMVQCKRKKNTIQWTWSALLKPAIDQGGSEPFENNIENNMIARFVLGVWLLTLIVIGSGFKSEVTSMVVIPEYTKPPTTFRELAYSNYQLFAIFWAGNLEEEFDAFQADFSQKISMKAHEYNYFDPDCYLTIFKGDHACIGYEVFFDLLARPMLVDVYGRKLFTLSKDTIFPVAINFGVSKYYGALHGRSNFMLAALESSGITKVWRKYHMWYFNTIGKQRAKETKNIYPIFGGADNNEPEDYKPLFIQMIVMGLGLSSVVFLGELLVSFLLCVSKT